MFRSTKGDASTKCVSENVVHYASMWSVQLRPEKGIKIDRTKIKLKSYEDTCVVGDKCLVTHGPFNVFGFKPKAGSKHVM